MSFTDEQLKTLKEAAKMRGGIVSFEDVRPLLARMEAAEKAAQFMYISVHPIDESGEEAYQAWRKAAGKEEA